MGLNEDTFMLDALLVLPPAREFVHYVAVSVVFGLSIAVALLNPIYARHATRETMVLIEERWVLPRVLQVQLIGALLAIFTLLRPFLPTGGLGSVPPSVWIEAMPSVVRYNALALLTAVGLILVNLAVFEPFAASSLISMRKRQADQTQDQDSPAIGEEDASELANDAAIIKHRLWRGLVVLTNFSTIATCLAYFSFLAQDTPLPTPTIK